MELEAKKVYFFSQQDEGFFFEWIGRIGCIENVVGRGDTIYLDLEPNEVLEDEVWEIAAVFRRYRIPLAQLRALDRDGYSRVLRKELRRWSVQTREDPREFE
ncbi:hypothetical protein WH218_18295 [Stenotrophomonas indicatrix]|uniref:hypothetical protein n=1 Tax=Stenotrophomonas indicatrix TaxID=2045451 RepID=UPI0015DFBF5D|nr:hypothetical protein [Stenotrophomonas indicatrix]MBA0100985.1 hypothetical protein [Stenotrophomonas indicatrix]